LADILCLEQKTEKDYFDLMAYLLINRVNASPYNRVVYISEVYLEYTKQLLTTRLVEGDWQNVAGGRWLAECGWRKVTGGTRLMEDGWRKVPSGRRNLNAMRSQV
jgi:hypothetical protein